MLNHFSISHNIEMNAVNSWPMVTAGYVPRYIPRHPCSPCARLVLTLLITILPDRLTVNSWLNLLMTLVSRIL